jgi:tRNA uracil 4-sulfurtransferase
MVKYDAIDVRFGEIGVKGRNRGEFIKALAHNVERAIWDEDYEKIERQHDRIMVWLSKKSDLKTMGEKLSCVFGIAWFAPVLISENNIKNMLKRSAPLVKKKGQVKIIASRAFKNTPFKSADITQAFIENAKKMGFEPDKDAVNELYLNVTGKGTMIFSEKTKGPGGLPVGTSGKAVLLLSGGLDSPVAAYYAMKRGLKLSYLHMHMYAKGKEASKSKISDLLKVLKKYTPERQVIYYAPAHIFQSYALKARGGYDLILLKRFLFAMAEEVAREEGAHTIVTGEALGQVASQTARNMISAQTTNDLLIMRPLVGFDKQEIVNLAKKLGTFDISVKPYKDVCSINSKNPPTASDFRKVRALYKEMGLEKALALTLKKTERFEQK